MIFLIFFCFICLAVGLGFLMSYELRAQGSQFIKMLLPQGRKKLLNVQQFAHHMHHAAAPDKLQSHWYLQQWWILFAGFLLFSSILIFAFTRPVSSTRIEADYLKEVDPQIYALLNGEILSSPPEVDETLIQEAIIEASQLEQAYMAQNINSVSAANIENPADHHHGLLDTTMVNRKWEKMNPRYKQRLLMVFKIMKEQHNYELVLLEGYRSPSRQNLLAGNPNTTRAKGYQSYHQFGLAADVAFKRNGKVVISERDPWAMRGYQIYGEVAESVGLTWGGRWKSIQDYGHTEYRMPGLKKTREMAEKLIAEAQVNISTDG
ncbi:MULTISPECIES: M15 family metallopeptidase [Acinetobacter]|jgi:peptidoglycan L-alanyl-D-glutamate endopeptidase CwlK|uniref:M15 family metallopeptidase n=1 Tax=Acinetobacter TaxID=469 RepID=UPI0003188A6D|nr:MULTISPECIES: M15 family metallopeptidase [Acinetobacter]EXB34013.1 D-alanyl-D-alanine carboxypeptidase family protein [Acinetobacter sp. 1461402]EXB73871.1 D-alanyl-D-alanine carboxypeptidase family protein [Acinetobacter sp. 230853]EXE14150.1 D-alanyl-D-alanine carboxypeptidase family protein [Acinetobacter sp. 983759]KCX38995.1 D-alanyl-D-alanine carboxypeptidase family protein [Acinetobacter sp. 263903-1]MCU4500267.1 M15 family metallopeptidase [Acinetobacter radioresistens]